MFTTTIDAQGADQFGNLAGERPNPLTGPCYIEGAAPGEPDLYCSGFDEPGGGELATNRDQ